MKTSKRGMIARDVSPKSNKAKAPKVMSFQPSVRPNPFERTACMVLGGYIFLMLAVFIGLSQSERREILSGDVASHKVEWSEGAREAYNTFESHRNFICMKPNLSGGLLDGLLVNNTDKLSEVLDDYLSTSDKTFKNIYLKGGSYAYYGSKDLTFTRFSSYDCEDVNIYLLKTIVFKDSSWVSGINFHGLTGGNDVEIKGNMVRVEGNSFNSNIVVSGGWHHVLSYNMMDRRLYDNMPVGVIDTVDYDYLDGIQVEDNEEQEFMDNLPEPVRTCNPSEITCV